MPRLEEKWPSVRVLHQARTHRVLPDVSSLYFNALVAAQPVLEEAALPDNPVLTATFKLIER